MSTTIRFGAFVREITVHQDRIPYTNLMPKILYDGDGNPLPCRAPRIALRPIDAYRLTQPYVQVRLMEQVRAVVPLAVYLLLFQLLILQQQVADAWIIAGGLLAVIIGLMFFMEGLKVGLMPFGEALGTTLPAKAPLSLVMTIALLLGIGVTFAEPAIGALKAAGQIVRVESAPYLYALLNDWAEVLVLGVGIGVGIAAVLGTLRFLAGWSLKPFIYLTLIPTIGLMLYILTDPELAKTLGLAWDCGAVTTGPVTVPLVLSLGIGIAGAAGKEQSSLSGFGIVTLASLFPIISVEVLAIYLSLVSSPAEIIAAAASTAATAEVSAWYAQTPWVEIIGGLRAIVPLVLFLFLVMRFVLQERILNPGNIAYGITLTVLGMIIFNLGLTYGLTKLGGQSGALVPAAFTDIQGVQNDPLYGPILGLSIAFCFAWVLGFGATLAEPALNALGLTVENLTNGAFRKQVLMYAVSLGVAFGLALGVAKIVFAFNIAWLLIPGYLLAVLLTLLSTEEFVNIAWDSAGVTTGPVTVPLVLAMGLGFGNAMDAIEGFGILSMASICPILSVLITGLYIQWKVKRKRNRYDRDMHVDESELQPTAVGETS
ncbi:MAG TPA: DUF1538 domain-containing protein [Chromatiaceae bacterium]|nr:MAG: hypothetical protein N838_08055 [Thiohalocapsa sp. PB-PSB1]QQO55729.1 MAG: DUF1538 domain-containing protein [Thiohalocapsa sp. PB-PSB1]HBG96116.1 DUF1538 domain-containing protein [Chromatiaceae bacterium]HCS90074.1 DUF1538 domain-containing protein [Chromatiaceae bacterium]